MKKKIGEIYNKPIVTGDKNLVTKNEIHESTLKGGTIDSGSSDVEYYKFNHPINIGDDTYNDVDQYALLVASTIKGIDRGSMISIISYAMHLQYIQSNNPFTLNTISGFSYLPIVLDGKLVSFTDFANFVLENENINILERLTPITKEEFYDLNNI